MLVTAGKPVSEVCHLFERVPQILENVRFEGGAKPLETESVKEAVKAGKKRLGSSGRILVRPSGTEPLLRVMAEGDDETAVREVVSEIVQAVRAQTLT